MIKPSLPVLAALTLCLAVLGNAQAVPVGNAQADSSCQLISIKAGSNGDIGPSGVNNSDTVVGTFLTTSIAFHGFRWTDGNGSLYDFPDATETFLGGINDLGITTGTSEHADGSSSGFLLMGGGQTQEFTVSGAFTTQAAGINNLGVVVGSYGTFEAGPVIGFVKQGSTYTDIQFPGAASTFPYSINDSGVIAGTYSDGSTNHGFVYINGQYMTLDVPGSSETEAKGINNSGTVVGEFRQNAQAEGKGFTYSSGKFTTFMYPTSTYTELDGINNAGDRLGSSITSDIGGFLSGPAFLLKCQ